MSQRFHPLRLRPKKFEVLLHASGFHVPVDDLQPIQGFYAIRRVLANNESDAELAAIHSLKNEAKYIHFVDLTKESLGSDCECRIEAEACVPLTPWRWIFSRCPAVFVMYQD